MILSGSTPQPGPLVWINAFAGVGKLTIARELVKALGGPEKAILIDNHTLIDVVTLPRDHKDYQAQRKAVRQSCFKQYVLCEPSGAGSAVEDKSRVVIFTDLQSTDETGSATAMEYQVAARRAGRRFVPVLLECEKEENVRRATGMDRGIEGKRKLVDEVLIRHFLDTVTLFEFKDTETLRFDVTERTPGEVAVDLAMAIKGAARWPGP